MLRQSPVKPHHHLHHPHYPGDIMGRAYPYLDHDDPTNYFNRLQSYSSLGPSFSRPNSLAQTPRSAPTTRPPTQTRSSGRTESRAYSVPDIYVESPPSPPRSIYSGPSAHTRSESSVRLWPKQSHLSEPVGTESEKSWIASLRSERLRLHDGLNELKRRGRWPKKRKIILTVEVAALVIVAVVVAVVIYLKETAYHYTPSNVHVTNAQAFTTGGATHASPNDVDDGIGKADDVYTYYNGGVDVFPPASQWLSFEAMWEANVPSISTSCSSLGYGSDNTASQTHDIYTAIQSRAKASLVDHRYILAIILQESHGCVHVPSTTSSGGVSNPGLMQSHNGASFSSSHASLSILAMVQDGTQGTSAGAGLVQNLNSYGDAYSAARAYNSGHVPKSGNLSEAAGATACYVSDVANRLTGWVNAKSTCPGDDD